MSADEDFSSSIDVDVIARALATDAFPAEECRPRIERYVREGDGDAGRGVEAIARAFKAAQAGDTAYKPGLIRLMSGMHAGAFASSKVWRMFGCFGHAIWHHYHSTELFDCGPSPIAELATQLAAHSDDPDATLRDLVAWVELGDEAALVRITPTVQRAGVLTLWEFGRTLDAGTRLIEVLTLRCADFAGKLDAILTHMEPMVMWESVLGPMAAWLERHEGPRAVPSVTTLYKHEHDPRRALAGIATFWRLATDHRDVFDARAAKLFARWGAKEDATLRMLGIIDDEHTITRTGKRGEPWRIFRAGRLVFMTSGSIEYLNRCSVTVHPTDAKARADYAKKLAAKKQAK